MHYETKKLTLLCPAVMNYTEMEAKVNTLDRKGQQPSSPSLPGSGGYK